jgi:glyoxylase-like metal-dependent hydrolase (beta-lactamase superfamily II)
MTQKRIALIFAVVMIAAPSAWIKPAASQSSMFADRTAHQAPGFYRFRLGDFLITVLSDGTAPRDLPEIMSKPDAVRSSFEALQEMLPVELSINCFLIDNGVEKILVDTGAGELYGSKSGHLVTNLRAAGYRPEEIDTILLTHIHGDHSGGLSVGGKRVFQKAFVYVDERDPEYWLSASMDAKRPDSYETTAQSHQTVDPYLKAGKLRTFDGATELFPGVRSIPEYGHTPGHTGYMLKSHGQRLLLWGDVVHAAEVQFKDPTITIEYDVDPEQAIASRQRVLAEAAQQGFVVGGAHLSFPGIGHVSLEQCGYVWTPAAYSSMP